MIHDCSFNILVVIKKGVLSRPKNSMPILSWKQLKNFNLEILFSCYINTVDSMPQASNIKKI